MGGMVRAMPAAEREAIMLRMFPQMMRKADMAKMIPEFGRTMGQLITLHSIYAFIAEAAGDSELRKRLSEVAANAKASMPEMMEMMHPVMAEIMPTLMPKMMSVMGPMMPLMAQEMPNVMDRAMVPVLQSNQELREQMLTMMQSVFPHCAGSMVPMIEPEARQAFARKMKTILDDAVSDSIENNENEE